MKIWTMAAVAALGLAACGDSGGDGEGGDAPASPEAIAVSIDQFAFAPADSSVPVGATVTWTNDQSGVAHTTTSDDAVWNSGSLNTGDEFSFTFDEAGTFSYVCSIHPNMTASVTVG